MKDWLRVSLIIVSGFLAFVSVHAQDAKSSVKIIEVDSDLGIIKNALPFDEPFFIKFTFDTPPRIRYFELLEGRFKFVNTTAFDSISNKDITIERKLLAKSHSKATINAFDIVKQEKKWAVFVPILRLNPDKDYNLGVFLAYTDLEIRQFLDKTFAINKLKQNYNRLIKAPETVAQANISLGKAYDLSTSLTISLAPRTIQVRETPIQTLKNEINQSALAFGPSTELKSAYPLEPVTVSETGTITPGADDVYASGIFNDYRKKADSIFAVATTKLQSYTVVSPNPLLRQLSQPAIKSAVDELLVQIKAGLIKTDTQSVASLSLQVPLTTLLTITDNTRMEAYLYGQRSLADVPEKVALNAINSRPDTLSGLLAKTSANLGKTIQLLTQINLYSRATMPTAAQPQLVVLCNDLLTDVKNRKKILDDLIDVYAGFMKLMQSDKRLVSYEKNASKTIDASSTIFDFDTRAKIQIIPDIGLAYYSAISVPMSYPHFSYDHKNFNGFVPYLGVNISLSPISKSIPMRYLQNMPGSVFRRFSFFVGISFNSIAKENERKDLLGSKSVLAGISYRLSNAFRIAGGSLLFNVKDPNPIISTYRLGAVPFISASLDLSLKQVATDFAGLFLPK